MKRLLLLVFTWWNGATFGTRLWTWWRGEFVGEDEFGNRYYRERNGPKRSVIYNGLVEASRIPPGWHAWMHHRSDQPPGPYEPREWQKPYEPNMTGSAKAYRPPGSILRPHPHTPARPDYEPWKP